MTMRKTDWSIYCWRSKGVRERRRRRGPLKVSLYPVCCSDVRETPANTSIFRKQEDKGEEEACCCGDRAKGIKVLARVILYLRIA